MARLVHLLMYVLAGWLGAATLIAREWSDSTGQFRIEAELHAVTSEGVQLRKPTGEIVTVPLTRLSAADQRYAQTAVRLSTEATIILKQHCHACHGQAGTDEGGMNFILNSPRLIQKQVILVATPEKSPLVKRIVDAEMPPEDVKARPSAEQIKVLQDWIAHGAYSPPESSSREFIGNDQIVDAIVADLQSADERTRVYYRYFTVAHLYNAGLPDDELQTFRLALVKLLNSLSWDRKLVELRPVDSAQTVYRVDIRDLRWSRELWDILLLAYPYGVRLPSAAAANCSKLAGTELPYLRADWFVAVAARPPLYHHLLQLPETVGGLQDQLKISFRENVRQDRAMRAGFNNSGISQNPRVIERHETTDGVCWVSYDFAASAGRRNFFTDPLNFDFDGSEIIFSLPNGLQAYMITDREGRRIDKAPTNIVRDTSTADATVVNGLSCMRCHASGIIAKHDEVRPHVTTNARAFAGQMDAIKALYPDDALLQQKMAEDRTRFGEALTQMGIRRASPEGEPIFNISRRFQDPLDIRLASAEFGAKPEDLLKAIERKVELQRLAGPLRLPGGTLPRDAFEAAYGPFVSALATGRFMAPVGRIRAPGSAELADADTPSDPGSAPTVGESASESAVPGNVRGGLIHHWRFDETKGELARDTVGRNNATVANYPTGSPRWVPGKIGNALQFSTHDNLGITSKGVDAIQFTIAFWLQVQLEEGANPRLVHPWVSLNYEKGQGVSVHGKIAEPTKPQPGEWYHYAVAIDLVKKTATIYRDGNEVASGRFEAARETGRWVFGHNQDPGNHNDSFNGLLDDVRVYKRILTADEVAQLAGTSE